MYLKLLKRVHIWESEDGKPIWFTLVVNVDYLGSQLQGEVNGSHERNGNPERIACGVLPRCANPV
jgi:hypothetical protein